MTVPTLTLADFLLARVAEDEAVAREAAGERLPHERPWWDLYANSGGYTPHVVMGPERLLAECEAKRRILKHHAPVGHYDEFPLCNICTEVGPDAQGWPCLTLRLLALPYADHPKYRDDWRP